MYSKQENFVSQVPHQFCVLTYPDAFIAHDKALLLSEIVMRDSTMEIIMTI